MYRNATIVGVAAALLGAGGAALATTGDEAAATPAVAAASADARLEQGRLLTSAGEIGACRRAPASTTVLQCALRYTAKGGAIDAQGMILADGRSDLPITGGSGAYRGAYGRVAVQATRAGRVVLDLRIVVPQSEPGKAA